ncbi:MAG: glycosyl transferase family 2, partial [Pseudomonadota bacterium]
MKIKIEEPAPEAAPPRPEPKAEAGVALSAIVTADGDGSGLAELLAAYLEALDGIGAPYELILVYEQGAVGIVEAAKTLEPKWPALQPIALRPWPGEDGALKVGIDQARGETILTLPGWSEVNPAEIGPLVAALGDDDMVVGRRSGADLSGLQRFRMGATHGLIRLLFGKRFEDVFCRARVGRRDMFAKIVDLGVRQHFLPVVAVAEGWRVKEAPVSPAAEPPRPPVYNFKPLAHVSALVDLLTLFVGLKFLRRPLRFFGAVGVPLFLIGLLATAWLVVSRLFFGEALADRPALVFSVAFLILGLQIVAL